VIRFEAAHFGGLNFSLDLTFLGYCERLTELRGTNKSPVYHRLALSDRCKTPLASNKRNVGIVQKEISFFSDRLGRKISGSYSLFGRMLTVTTPDGRQKSAPLGSTNPEIIARLTLIELEARGFEQQRHSRPI